MDVTRETQMQMIEMALNGATVFDISQGLGYKICDVEAALTLLSRKGVHRNRKGHAVYPAVERWMLVNGMTQRDLGAVLGVSAAAAGKILNGERGWDKEKIDKIICATGLSYEELFGDPRKIVEV